MSEMRVRLIELLYHAPCESELEGCPGSCPYRKHGQCGEVDRLDYCAVQHLADHLIASGVVVSKMETTTKWIPVTERLPKEEDADITGCVLAIEKSDGFARRWEIQGIYEAPEYFTHWMTLPEPPKGE